MSEEFLTRRQLREREVASATDEPTVTRRELRDRERAIQERLQESSATAPAHPVKIPESSYPAAAVASQATVEPEVTKFLDEPAPFVDSANPGTIPTQIIQREVSTETNSIVLPTLPDITSSSFTVPQSNIVVTTGAIDIPQQPTTLTGEIKLVVQTEPVLEIAEPAISDAADTSKVGILGIDPVPARSLPKKNKEKVFPGRLRRGWGVVYLVLGVALLMATFATAIFLAYAYKII